MRFSHTLALTAAAAVALVGVAGADPKQYTLDDCKFALNSLKEKPYSSSLPSMAASTGTCFCRSVREESGGGGRAMCVCRLACVGVCMVPLAWLKEGRLPSVCRRGGREGRGVSVSARVLGLRFPEVTALSGMIGHLINPLPSSTSPFQHARLPYLNSQA